VPSTQFAYLRSANAEQTSFWSDDQHFSAAGQMLEAAYDFSLIVPAPVAGAGLPGLISPRPRPQVRRDVDVIDK
jgi:hypothetical protein